MFFDMARPRATKQQQLQAAERRRLYRLEWQRAHPEKVREYHIRWARNALARQGDPEAERQREQDNANRALEAVIKAEERFDILSEEQIRARLKSLSDDQKRLLLEYCNALEDNDDERIEDIEKIARDYTAANEYKEQFLSVMRDKGTPSAAKLLDEYQTDDSLQPDEKDVITASYRRAIREYYGTGNASAPKAAQSAPEDD